MAYLAPPATLTILSKPLCFVFRQGQKALVPALVMPLLLGAALNSSLSACVSALRPSPDLEQEVDFLKTQTFPEFAVEPDKLQPHPAEEFSGDWWKMFGDPKLNEFIDDVMQGNHGVQQAILRVRQLEAAYQMSSAALLPQLSLGIDISRTRTEQTLPQLRLPQNSPPSFVEEEVTIHSTVTQFFLGLGYELDLFGKNRHAAAAAGEGLRSVLYGTLHVCQQTLQQATKAYFLAIESSLQVQLSRENVRVAQEYLELVKRRYALGQAGILDVNQAQDSLLNARTTLPFFQDAHDQALNALARVLGQTHTLNTTVHASEFPLAQNHLQLEAPWSVVQTRADVLAALHQVRQADEQASAALASRFPSLSFSARVGYPAESLEEVFSPESMFWQLIGNLTAPVFAGGRLRAAWQARELELAEKVLNYKETVIFAFNDVKRAVMAMKSIEERESLTMELLRNSRLTLQLATEKYRQGLAPILNVLTSQQAVFRAERNLLTITRERLDALVSLVIATGGLWVPGEVLKAATGFEELQEDSSEVQPKPLPAHKTSPAPEAGAETESPMKGENP